VSLGRARHPEQLPWFASGRVGRAQAAAIERHLQRCEECRAEVSALRSMYRSIREETVSAHVAPVRLVAYYTRDPQCSEHDRRLIDEHLRTCHACSADLMALERADAPVHPKRARRFLGAAASILIVAAAGWQLASWRPRSAIPAAVTHVVFRPAQRGASAAPLIGAGPWELEVWLPLHASAPGYRARIYRSDDPSNTIFETSVVAGPKDESVLLLVPGGLLRPGHHELQLISQDGGGSGPDVRGFDVERAP
jgi:hypothetical protein